MRLHRLAKALARQAGEVIISTRQSSTTLSNSNVTLPPFKSFEAVWHHGVSAGLASISSFSSMVHYVNKTDRAFQKTILLDKLRWACPSHRLVDVQNIDFDEALDDRPTWIVDTMDGTVDFDNDMSSYCVSIAFMKDRKVIIGVVYNPSSDEMFSAVRGHGAFLNGERLSLVKPCTRLRDALVSTEWKIHNHQPALAPAPADDDVDKVLNVYRKLLMLPVRGIRQLGCGNLNLCYVASGRVQAVYGGVSAADKWNVSDFAAGLVIADEAGADVTSVDGSPFELTAGRIACAAPGIILQLIDVINS